MYRENMEKPLIERELQISPETYFESVEEWNDFASSITQTFNRLTSEGKEDVRFHINDYWYTEYGETYSDLQMKFDYSEEMTEAEIAEKCKRNKEFEIQNKLDKILSSFKLDANTIYSIKSSKILTDKVLRGELVFESRDKEN